jgi:hypothetical protein
VERQIWCLDLPVDCPSSAVVWELFIEIYVRCKSHSLPRKPRKLAPALDVLSSWPSFFHDTIPTLTQNTPYSVKYSSLFQLPLTEILGVSNAEAEQAPCRCQNITACSKLSVSAWSAPAGGPSRCCVTLSMCNKNCMIFSSDLELVGMVVGSKHHVQQTCKVWILWFGREECASYCGTLAACNASL